MIQNNLNVGDRVKCIREVDDITEGMIGTIVHIRCQDVGVKWDDWYRGHNCNERTGSSGWYVPNSFVSKKYNSTMIFRVNSSGSFRIRKIREDAE